jgi:signal transduction histidine kinase/CheY-like chemotaxis protein
VWSPSTWLQDRTVAQRLTLMVSLGLASLCLCVLVLGTAVLTLRVNGPVYQRLYDSMSFVTDVYPPPLYAVEPYAHALEMVDAPAHELPHFEAELEGHRREWSARGRFWRARLRGEAMRTTFERAMVPVEVFYELIHRELLPAMRRGDRTRARQVARGPLRAVFQTHRIGVDEMVVAASAQQRAVEARVHALLVWSGGCLLLFIVALAASLTRASLAVSRRISAPLEDTVRVLERIAGGDLQSPPLDAHNDEFGRMRRALVRTVDALREGIARLEASRVHAEAGERAKSQFLAAMTHELRTPLNGVLGMAELLQGAALEPAAREQVRTLVRSAESLLRLVDDLLLLIHLDAHEVAPDLVPLDACELVHEVLRAPEVGAAAPGVGRYIDVEGEMPALLRADARLLRRALCALLGNALKFTHEGAVRVSLRWANDALTITVADTGPGIARDHQARIFEAFYQVDASSTRREGGVGLGLALAASIARLLGGEVTVESEPGAGARFALRVRAVAEVVRASLAVDVRGRRVAVVSDSAVGREVLAAQIRRSGAEVIGAVSHAALQAHPEALRGDAVVVDCAGDPAGTSQTLAALRGLRGTRVVLVHDAQEAPDNARVDAVLRAPLNPEHLRRALIRVLELTRPTTRKGTSAGIPRLTSTPFAVSVLLAEDDPVNQKVARALLSRLGCSVDVVPNGREAVTRALAQHYDICFMDCRMPEVDGFEATTEIRARWHEDRPLPIVALTANAMPSDRAKCTEAGMDDFVAKPIRVDELKRVLQRFRVGGARAPTAVTALRDRMTLA